MSFHFPHPFALAVGGLVLAAEAAAALGGILGEVIPPTTIIGAVILADRVLQRSRNDALRLARETAEEAGTRLDDEREEWTKKEVAYKLQIADLEEEVIRYRRLAFGFSRGGHPDDEETA